MNDPELLPAPVALPDSFSTRLNALGDAFSEVARRLIDLFQPIGDAICRGVRAWVDSLQLGIAHRQKRERAHVHAQPRPRNTRVRMVQAKRKALGLSQDGKCCGLRTRKASYAFRKEEQWLYETWWLRLDPRTFEHVPARRRKKDARQQRVRERIWMAYPRCHCALCQDYEDLRYDDQMDAVHCLMADLSTFVVDNRQSEVHHG